MNKLNMTFFGLVVLTVFTTGALVSCVPVEPTTDPGVDPGTNLGGDTDTAPQATGQNVVTRIEGTDKLKKFEDEQAIVTFLEEIQGSSAPQRQYFGGFADEAFGVAVAESAAMDAGAAQVKTAPSPTSPATDFSTTNVQVENVDEADIVKNDGKYIYTVVGQQVVIVDAFPADNAEIVSEIAFTGTPTQIFINDDILVVFEQDNTQVDILPRFVPVPTPRYTQVTNVHVFDVSDRDDPELEDTYTITGNFFQARMIDDVVYFITRDSVYYYDNVIDVPILMAGNRVVAEPDVFYFDNPEDNYVFHTISSLDLGNNNIEAATFMMGWSNTMYMSEDNIYITYQKNEPWWNYQEREEERFYEVVLPLLPSDVRSKINKIRNNDDSAGEQWRDISIELQNMYNNMEKRDKENLIEDIQEAIEEYEIRREIERSKTVVHKIAVDDGDISYEARGEVPGSVLNQFSMDEYDGNFRIATTTNLWLQRERVQYNNVFVLDEDLDTIGELEDIAPDERIFSTRFIGDRLYMVTFKQIDPLFVIDLSNPTRPTILGELKIPGFSDYLHPYDEDHIIGVGKETDVNEYDQVTLGGVKVALFDVSDVENPKQIDTYEIGERGSDSEVLHDHKAFLFDRERNLLVMPVREIKDRYKDPQYGYYRNRVWQGAYVFSVSPRDGFEVEGRITHADDEDGDDYYYYSPSAVRRALYMDDVLYTISTEKIKMNDLDDIDDEINEVELPYKEQRYRDYPYPVIIDTGGVAIGAPSAVEETPVEIRIEG